MITSLITVLATRLTAGLQPVPVQTAPFSPLPSALPALALYPGQLTLLPLARAAPVQATYQREFQQELWVAAYAPTTTEAEKWAQLACAVALHTTPALLAAANQTAPQQTPTFSAASFFTQLQLTEGHWVWKPTVVGYQLKFTVTGELHLTQLAPESVAVIQEVVLQTSLGTQA